MRRRMMILALTLAVMITAFAVAEDKDAVPTPRLVTNSWQLEFEYEPPQSINIRLPGEKTKQTYWYMVYTVTNRTGADRRFLPEFVMYTDTGQILRAGKGVPVALFEHIKSEQRNPLLLDMGSVVGKLLQGEDNAKDGVAIWKDFDPKARSFDIFAGGVCGEKVTIDLPTPIKRKNAAGEVVTKRKVTLLKTLKLTYAIPGEAAARPRTKPQLVRKGWVMR